MNKKIMITLGIMMCLTLVSAGLSIPIIMDRYEKQTDLTTIQESRIKLSSNIDEIDVDISPIQCNNIECYAKLSQPNVINTEWRRDKTYCSNYSVCEIEEHKKILDEMNDEGFIEEECIVECIEWSDYTLEENQQAVEDYLNKRLGDYANAEEIRKGNTLGIWETKDAGGNLRSAVEIATK